MAFVGNNLLVYDRNRRARDTAIGAHVHRWKALGLSFARILLGFEHVDMPFERHSDEVGYVSLLNDWL